MVPATGGPTGMPQEIVHKWTPQNDGDSIDGLGGLQGADIKREIKHWDKKIMSGVEKSPITHEPMGMLLKRVCKEPYRK